MTRHETPMSTHTQFLSPIEWKINVCFSPGSCLVCYEGIQNIGQLKSDVNVCRIHI
jgi:hypothetical protein